MNDVVAAENVGEDRPVAESHPRFDELYRRWYRPVVRICRQRLGRGHDPEATAQEAFIRAWSSWWRYSEERPFGPWVTSIARRLCSTEARVDARREGILARQTPGLPDLAEDSSELAMRSHGVEAAFRSLSPRARRLIVLRDVEGWSYEDMAGFDGVSVDAVRGALKRARAAFRAAYEQAAGAPAAVGIGAPSWVRRVRRFFEVVPARVSSLEPVAAGVALLLAPLAPAAQMANGPAVDAPAVALVAAAPSAVTDAQPVVPPVSVPVPVPEPVADAAAAVVAAASNLVEPVAEGVAYRFTASPNYEQDRTVFALGRTRPCGRSGCAVLLKSTDGGATWTRLPAEGVEPGRVMLSPDYPRDDRIFVHTKHTAGLVDALSLSRDGGRTFVQVAQGLGSPSMTMSSRFSSGDPRIVLGATAYQPALAYHADTDTVTPLSLPLPLEAVPMHFAFGSEQTTLVSTYEPAGRSGVFRCDDDGCTRTLDVRHLDFRKADVFRLTQAGDVTYAWTRYEMYRSTDDGRSFERAVLPKASEDAILLALVADARGRIHARTQTSSAASRLHVSSDLGSTWTYPEATPWSLDELVVLPDGVILAAPFPVNAPSFVCSTDDGVTWSTACRRAA